MPPASSSVRFRFDFECGSGPVCRPRAADCPTAGLVQRLRGLVGLVVPIGVVGLVGLLALAGCAVPGDGAAMPTSDGGLAEVDRETSAQPLLGDGGTAAPAHDGEDAGAIGDGGVPADPEPTTAAPVYAVDVSVHTKTLTDPDVDCLWAAGVRHIIVGTQSVEVSRQQLKIAIRGGMTVDLYVYLYWNQHIVEQVREAVVLATDYPEVGRIWLDVEDRPGALGDGEIKALIREAMAAAGDVPIGLYTSEGWWDTYFGDAAREFAELPLWYARYDDRPTLDTWAEHRFGGWSEPIGKQYMDNHRRVCDLTLDHNVMLVDEAPAVVRVPPPADPATAVPLAPADLHPDDGLIVTTDFVRYTAPAVAYADRYEMEIEFFSGGVFRPYLRISTTLPHRTQYPVVRNAVYRWRMRAINGHGAGEYSPWSTFDFGRPTQRPAAGP